METKKPVIKNIKLEELSFDGIQKIVEKNYPLVKFTAEEVKFIKANTPKPLSSLKYELHDANTALANGWRRIVKDEIVYPHFTVHTQDIKSDDDYCQRLTDYIQNRIWLIPTSYIPKANTKTWKWSLNVRNTTLELLTVTSASIEYTGEGKSPVKWDHMVEVIELRAGKSISMTLTLDWNQDSIHASFSKTGPALYKPLEFKEPFPPSYTVHPTAYELGLTIQSDLVTAMEITIIAWETLLAKLKSAILNIETFDEKIPYSSSKLNVTASRGNLVVYEFLYETYSLINVLSWYAYLQDKTIKSIYAADDHPEDDSKLIKLNHSDHKKLLLAGAKNAVRDVEHIIAKLNN